MCLCLYTRQGYSVVDLNRPVFFHPFCKVRGFTGWPGKLRSVGVFFLFFGGGWKMLENSVICCSNLRISSSPSRDFDVNEIKLGCLRVVSRGKSFFGLRRVTSPWDFLRDVFC